MAKEGKGATRVSLVTAGHAAPISDGGLLKECNRFS